MPKSRQEPQSVKQGGFPIRWQICGSTAGIMHVPLALWRTAVMTFCSEQVCCAVGRPRFACYRHSLAAPRTSGALAHGGQSDSSASPTTTRFPRAFAYRLTVPIVGLAIWPFSRRLIAARSMPVSLDTSAMLRPFS